MNTASTMGDSMEYTVTLYRDYMGHSEPVQRIVTASAKWAWQHADRLLAPYLSDHNTPYWVEVK